MNDAPKRRIFLGGGNSQKDRIIQVGIIFLAILIIGFITLTIVSNIGKDSTVNLYKVAAAQQDISELTSLSSTKLHDTQLANTSATVGIVVASQNVQTLATLSSLGDKKPAKNITNYRDTSYTKLLDEAQKNGTYDQTYATLLTDRLNQYKSALQTAYTSTKQQAAKQQLSNAYAQLTLLTAN